MADVFLSYGREDKERIQIVLSSLRSLELSVWSDARIGTGTHWDEVIEAELDEAKAVLVCWSRDASSSRWVRSEAKFAQDHGKFVPCQLEPCKIPLQFQFDQAEDISDWTGAPNHPAWRKILEAIGERVERPGLVNLLDALASGQNRDLLTWAQKFREDPFAETAFQQVITAEQIYSEGQLALAGDKAKKMLKAWDETFSVAFEDYKKRFADWNSNIRSAMYESRPSVWDALEYVRLSPPVTSETGEIQTQREAALKQAADAEDRLKVFSKQKQREKAVSIAIACVVGILSGYLIHYIVSPGNQDSQLQALQVDNSRLIESEKSLRAQLASNANTSNEGVEALREQIALANKALQEERNASQSARAALDSANIKIATFERQKNEKEEKLAAPMASLPAEKENKIAFDNEHKIPFKIPDGDWSIEKKARCKLSFAGQDYINGPCYWRRTPDKIWFIRSIGASKPYKAYWQVENGAATGYWNGQEAASSEPIELLEKDRSDKACWISKSYRLCIY